MGRNPAPPPTRLPELARALASLREDFRVEALSLHTPACNRHPELAGVGPALRALKREIEIAEAKVAASEKKAAEAHERAQKRARLRVVK